MRLEEEGVIGGVAAGIGARLGVDPLIVRLSFLVVSTAAGAGILIYVLLRVWLPAAAPGVLVERREPTVRHAVAVALVTQGLMLLLGSAGVYLTDALSVPVGLAALGSGLVWVRASEDERAVWRSAVSTSVGERAIPDARVFGPIRLVIGVCLVFAGIVAFFIGSDLVTGLGALTDVLVASGVTLVGVALVIGPWLQRQAGQLSAERRERIRSEERADMAAHLHDSVLQTLALIQRADSREEITRLARGQERELRSWLFGRRPDDAPTTLGQAIMDLAGRVEDHYGVSVDVVRAGEVALDEHLIAMAEASGEAMTNAAKHSGADRVDVFVEVEPTEVSIFIRDEGVGFDVQGVASDRRGLVYSIEDRMVRHGGKATVISDPGEGTEIELTLPLDGVPAGGETQTTTTAEQDPGCVLHRPVLPARRQEELGAFGSAADVPVPIHRRLPTHDRAIGLDHHQALEPLPGARQRLDHLRVGAHPAAALLDPPVPGVALLDAPAEALGAEVQEGVPDRGAQRGLVLLDREQVVGPALHDLVGDRRLAAHRVDRHQRPVEREHVQQASGSR